MGLEINNATFNAFVEFAKTQDAAGKQRAVARVDTPKAGGLEARTIKAASGDWVGIGAGRLKSLKEANNVARDLFRQAVSDMFGGEDHIPDSVKDAMKLADYGKGKPLTARRILAVKAAIDQISTCIADSKVGLSNVYSKGKCDATIEKAVLACNGNSDAMEIVKSQIGPIMVNAVSQFRDEAKVLKTVAGIMDNLHELKELSKNNPGIYAAGKQMLMDLGFGLPKGMITKLVQACNEAPINGLRRLSAKHSDAVDIHDVTFQMQKSITRAMVSAGVGVDKLEGADEKIASRNFIAATILSRCSKGALKNIRGAFDSPDGARLSQYYSLCEGGHNSRVDDQSKAIQEGVKDMGGLGISHMELIYVNVNFNLDRLEPTVSHTAKLQEADEVLDMDDIGGADIIERTIDLAREINEESLQNFLSDTVKGSGQGADAFKAVLRNKIGESNSPGSDILGRLAENANAMMNINIPGEMNRIASGQTSQFEKDIYRSGPIILNNGGAEITLDKNFETARDQLAQFITGDAKSTYGKLGPEDKNKVHLMMSMISQETEKVAEMGSAFALDTREGEMAFSTGGTYDKGTRKYEFAKLRDGGISFHYTMNRPIVTITTDDCPDVELGSGSSFNCEIDYTLRGNEFNRLAKLDYTKYNDDATKKELSTTIAMPDGTKGFPERYYMNVVDKIPDDFKIDANCKMDLNMTLNPNDKDLMAAQIAEIR